MPRPGGPSAQQRPPQPPPHQHPQQHHSHQPPPHRPFSPQEAHALMLDLAGAAAAATLMLVLTCWLLSLGGAFAPGHAQHQSSAAAQGAQR